MTDDVATLHESDEIYRLLREVDRSRLEHELGALPPRDTIDDIGPVIFRLRVAAIVAASQTLADTAIHDLVRSQADHEDSASASPEALQTFRKWVGYLDAMAEGGMSPSVDDLVLFAATGFLARRMTEVRAVLRQPTTRAALEDAMRGARQQSWSDRVRNNIGNALLLLVRQGTREDVQQASQIIQSLAADQKTIEATWLEQQSNPPRDATALLGLYHLAQAVVRVSEYLLTGSVERDGRLVTDFGPELGRLLLRAEEYLNLSRDLEWDLWLGAVGAILLRLRSDSIWASGSGISERLDALLAELAKVGRERPVFSLLPAQQEALHQSLLDPTRLAIVLQMPTSAGKTLLAEFTIIQSLEAYKELSRVVYLTPTRALATQVRRTLSEDLRPVGINVSAAGSAFEEDPFELHLLESTDGVVVATPEKLDLLLRSQPQWFDSLRLVVVDEAHLLKDSERGVRLELLLANLRREQPQARILLLTPFVENAPQIASWLGGARGLSISVHWRPSRLLSGFAQIGGRGQDRALTVEWMEPYDSQAQPSSLRLPVTVPSRDLHSALDRVVFLADRFSELGTVLAMFAGSRSDAEQAARRIADRQKEVPIGDRPPGLKLAIALARDEFGQDSILGKCLESGVAYHHSALSPILRYLIEDQARAGHIRFLAATTTLAQGINFPVATVLIHSVAKPWGQGNLSTSEFWNIAGRAGRVGMVDKGLVIFANPNHRELWLDYGTSLAEEIRSALLRIVEQLASPLTLKELYRNLPELRPFFQYLTHAAATRSPADAVADLVELLQASLANAQISEASAAQALRIVARRYLREEMVGRQVGYLKTIDTTGLGSFSFNELYAKIGDDPLLVQGPGKILQQGEEGLYHLIDALRWLPELSLSLTSNEGSMDVEIVAKVVQGWVDGKSIYELSEAFPGRDQVERTRNAATYIYGRVSQTMSWGAHAYIRGWSMRRPETSKSIPPKEAMLPAYLEYGVNTPEAAVASLLSMPRQLAEPFATEYRKRHGSITPAGTGNYKTYLEEADEETWSRVISQSPLRDEVAASDARRVWRQMQGLS